MAPRRVVNEAVCDMIKNKTNKQTMWSVLWQVNHWVSLDSVSIQCGRGLAQLRFYEGSIRFLREVTWQQKAALITLINPRKQLIHPNQLFSSRSGVQIYAGRTGPEPAPVWCMKQSHTTWFWIEVTWRSLKRRRRTSCEDLMIQSLQVKRNQVTVGFWCNFFLLALHN